jgi:2-haloacid dehalogenase
MEEQSFDAVVFDLGGVLINWNPRHLYKSIFARAEEMEQFLATVCTQEWNELHDAGASYEDTMPALIRKYPHFEKQIRAYSERWSEMLGEALDGTVEVLHILRAQKKHRLLALTNCPADKYQHEVEKYPFLQWFEGALVSGEAKMKKPDPRIFELLISKFKLNPQRTIFIDDSQKNVEVANSLGIHGIHFKSPSALLMDLRTTDVIR